MPDVSRWLAELEDDRENRQVAWGWQAWVQLGDAVVVDDARGIDGVRRPLTPDSLHRLYCVGRPFTAVAVATLVEAGRIGFETRLGDIVDGLENRALADVTVAQLLCHRSGLHGIGAGAFAVMRESERTDAVLQFEPRDPGAPVGIYDEYLGWRLLGLIVDEVSGGSWRDYVRDAVLVPMGLEHEVFPGFDAEQFTANSERLAVNVDLTPETPVAMLGDATELVARQAEPAVGVYSSMRGLGRFYAALRGCMLGTAAPSSILTRATLEQMAAPATERGWDPLMERECAYGLGFMVGLRDQYFGTRVSDDAFGHGGFRDYGGFYDPAHDLVVAIQYVGLVHVDRSEALRRDERFDLLYECLGLAPAEDFESVS